LTGYRTPPAVQFLAAGQCFCPPVVDDSVEQLLPENTTNGVRTPQQPASVDGMRTRPMLINPSNSSTPGATLGAGAAIGLSPALSANVLVLNKFYQAIRVVNVKRAFSLLCKQL